MTDNFFLIGSHKLGIDPCYIIAEVASNHDKTRTRAFEMIRRASVAGANGVKFQLFKADQIAARINIPETRLDDQFAKFGNTVHDLYKDMELPNAWLRELKACCDEHSVDFLATPFDEESAEQLAEIGVQAIKVASFEITHIPFLKYLGKLALPILLSTGMANLGEIEMAIKTIRDAGENRIALFHCGIEYPTPFDSVHLRCQETLRIAFNCPIGYSDHTEGITVPIAAVALGAALYEKHVTLPDGKSPDHDFALSMDEFSKMVKCIRQCEAALGSSVKKLQESERKYFLRGRRSIFVIKDVKKGDLFTKNNLAVLRRGVGIPPIQYDQILGKRSTQNIKAPALLTDGNWH